MKQRQTLKEKQREMKRRIAAMPRTRTIWFSRKTSQLGDRRPVRLADLPYACEVASRIVNSRELQKALLCAAEILREAQPSVAGAERPPKGGTE